MASYSDTAAANLNEGFVVAINLVANEGEGDAVAELLKRLAQPTMAEEGVKFFMPYRSPTDPLMFFIYELYVDEAGWDAHNSSEHFQSAIKELSPRLSHRERIPFIPFI